MLIQAVCWGLFHRSKLIGVTLTKKGVPVIHIDENDRQQTQETVIEILTNGQLFLLGDGILPSCTAPVTIYGR